MINDISDNSVGVRKCVNFFYSIKNFFFFFKATGEHGVFLRMIQMHSILYTQLFIVSYDLIKNKK